MKSQITSLFLVCLSVGCTMPDEILVSNAFLPEEEAAVQAALDEWEEAMDTDTGVTLTFGWQPVFEFDEDTFESHDGKATMHVVEKYSKGYQSVAHHYDEDFAGYTRYNTTWSIVMVRQNDPDDTEDLQSRKFYHVALHEFGHYLGHYRHNGKKGVSLMNDTVDSNNPVVCIDQGTLDRMCRFWDCGPSAHSTCE